MDECNQLQRDDADFDTGLIHVPGTKTAESECYMPMSEALQRELKTYLDSRTDDSPYIFPGRSAQTEDSLKESRHGLQCLHGKNPGTPAMKAWKQLKREDYPGGVKLRTKELRDYFCNQASAQISDPNMLKSLMRHTNLNTTSRYTRIVLDRMKLRLRNSEGYRGGISMLETCLKRHKTACSSS